MNFFYTKDSIPIQNVKKNVEMIDDMLSKKKPIRRASSYRQ